MAAQAKSSTVPVMLRVYDDDKIGSTAFFRNRPLLTTLLALFRASGKDRIEVLFHACSIGAEPYSLAIWCAMAGLDTEMQLNIHATDINPNFLAHARAAIYPEEVLAGMTEQERRWFEPRGAGKVGVRPEIVARVNFLPPASFVDFQSERSFDVVCVLNALTYVTPEQQSTCLRHVAGYNPWLLVTSAFHPDTIEADLVACGYAPITDSIQAIHDAWVERVRSNVTAQPGTREYSWMLPPFAPVPGYEYKYCALFRKQV
jgi:hypothetical protein